MSAYLDWKAGDKVAFINSGGVVNLVRKGWRKWLPRLRLRHNLVLGEVYTIEGATIHNDEAVGDVVCVYLRGFAFTGYPHVAFPAVWFSKVQHRKTDISIFTALLTSTKRKVSA